MAKALALSLCPGSGLAIWRSFGRPAGRAWADAGGARAVNPHKMGILEISAQLPSCPDGNTIYIGEKKEKKINFFYFFILLYIE